MDPDENLAEQRRRVARIQQLGDAITDDEGTYEIAQQAVRLAELAQALDEWIVGGGFLPRAWVLGRPR